MRPSSRSSDHPGPGRTSAWFSRRTLDRANNPRNFWFSPFNRKRALGTGSTSRGLAQHHASTLRNRPAHHPLRSPYAVDVGTPPSPPRTHNDSAATHEARLTTFSVSSAPYRPTPCEYAETRGVQSAEPSRRSFVTKTHMTICAAFATARRSIVMKSLISRPTAGAMWSRRAARGNARVPTAAAAAATLPYRHRCRS